MRVKRTAMQVFRFFTIIKFYAFYFSTGLGHCQPLIDKVGLRSLQPPEISLLCACVYKCTNALSTVQIRNISEYNNLLFYIC